MRRDLGDFQTPPALVAQILEMLGPVGTHWPRVLEPTCGTGNFIAGLLAGIDPPREIQAFEIQECHFRAASQCLDVGKARGVSVRIVQRDLFKIDLNSDLTWQTQGPLLVIGNPPWVTNSELGSLSSTNRPPRRNLKKLRGIEARTGASNFDITEAIWLKLASELADQQPTIALLCKTSVARNVLQFCDRAGIPIVTASIRRIDAARSFGAAVDACFFQVTLGQREERTNLTLRVPVYSSLEKPKPEAVMGFASGRLIANLEAYSKWEFADGVCPMEWRQGLKHDAAAVMELARDTACSPWRNRSDELIDVEPAFVYPLVKGTDLTRSPSGRPERAVLVTQERLGASTERLASQAPRLWSYLQSHAASFVKRKSSIYHSQPPFAIFGIGPYSFAPFKVAISGMHKEPQFRTLGSIDGKPTMLDDTCYFLPCSTALEASILTAVCNDPITLGLIGSMSFRDAKRPITKKLLQRIDINKVLEHADRPSLIARATAALCDDLAMTPTEPIVDVLGRMADRTLARDRTCLHLKTP